MTQKTIDLGTQGGADGTGDSIRAAGKKINDNFDEIYANSAMSSQISISGNNIKTTLTNADLFLEGSGTGTVAMSNILVDSNIKIDGNKISTLLSNGNLELAPNGTGSVVIPKIDINDGDIDNTVIGATTPAAGTFTTLSIDTLDADGISITDNQMTATSNADIELEANSSGRVKLNQIAFPSADGTVGDILKTDGSGALFFQGHSTLYDHSFIEDSTATVLGSSSAVQVIDTWSASTHRSVKYHLQISDSTADRYGMIEANVTHDGSNAYISVFGGVDNGTGDGSTVYDSLTFTSDISGGNVRLLGTVNNTNDQVVKLVRRTIKV